MDLRYNEKGLVPAICQDADSGEVLMLAWMNAEAFARTTETGQVHFWSRSRNELWHKGATSGSYLLVEEIRVDCDADALLVRVRPEGPACHTGNRSCFYRQVTGGEAPAAFNLDRLEEVIGSRRSTDPDVSYTARLLAGEKERRLQKVGEEAVEVVVAAGGQGRDRTVEETADLLYHLLVLLAGEDIPLREIYAELGRRHR